MSDKSSSSSSGGIGFCGLLTIVFITLKLCHVINWSWWWILAPLWISTGLVLAIIAGFAGVWLVLHCLHRWGCHVAEKRRIEEAKRKGYPSAR